MNQLVFVTHAGKAFIPLARYKGNPIRRFAVVDDDQLALVAGYMWSEARRTNFSIAPTATLLYRTYAQARVNGTAQLMHIMLYDPMPMVVDHLDHNGLNNVRTNIRICPRGKNATNRHGVANRTSRFKGVSWRKDKKTWRASIGVNGRHVFLGHFDTEERAAEAYDIAAINYHGEFAHTNAEEMIYARTSRNGPPQLQTAA